MNSIERIRRAVAHLETDFVPVAPYLGNHGARIAGVPIGQYCRCGRLMAQAQYRAWEIYGQDVVVPQSDNYYIAEGFGVAVEHYEDSTPTWKAAAVDDLDRVYTLEAPDPQKAGRMPVYLEAIRRLAGLTRGEAAVRAPGTGPFSLASHILGTERFLCEIAFAERSPGCVREQALLHLMDLATTALTTFALACLDAGAHVVQAGDSLASTDMISPATYRKWAFPFERKFFQAVNPRAETCGAVTLLHICGNTTPVLETMADTGARILELDHKVDLASAKRAVGTRVCLMGNLDPVGLLWQGSAEQVEAAAHKAIAAASTGGGFILGSGCEVPPAAPTENIAAMVRAARQMAGGV